MVSIAFAANIFPILVLPVKPNLDTVGDEVSTFPMLLESLHAPGRDALR